MCVGVCVWRRVFFGRKGEGVWSVVSRIKWLFAILRMCSVSTEGGTIFLKELGKDQHNRVFEKILSPKGFDLRREEELLL